MYDRVSRCRYWYEVCVLAIAGSVTADISVVDAPPGTGGNDYYVNNKAPPAPSPYKKLPIGSIRPYGGCVVNWNCKPKAWSMP